jgi:hypothetical protein
MVIRGAIFSHDIVPQTALYRMGRIALQTSRGNRPKTRTSPHSATHPQYHSLFTGRLRKAAVCAGLSAGGRRPVRVPRWMSGARKASRSSPRTYGDEGAVSTSGIPLRSRSSTECARRKAAIRARSGRMSGLLPLEIRRFPPRNRSVTLLPRSLGLSRIKSHVAKRNSAIAKASKTRD